MTKQPPVTLRVPAATRQHVEAWAAERGLTRNAAYDMLPAVTGGERIRLGECADAAHTGAIIDAWLGRPGRAVLHLYL